MSHEMGLEKHQVELNFYAAGDGSDTNEAL